MTMTLSLLYAAAGKKSALAAEKGSQGVEGARLVEPAPGPESDGYVLEGHAALEGEFADYGEGLARDQAREAVVGNRRDSARRIHSHCTAHTGNRGQHRD